MPRRGLLVATLLVVPALALAGCIEEDLDVALSVPSGKTLTLTGPQGDVDGTLLVESGATLLLEGARLRIAQALVVEPGATLRAIDSRIDFSGSYARQDLEVHGQASFVRTQLEGLRNLEAAGGETRFENGSVEAGRLRILAGSVASESTAWMLGPPESWDGGPGAAIEVAGAQAELSNGSLVFGEGTGLGVVVAGGVVHLRHLDLDLTPVSGPGLVVEQGELHLTGVGARVDNGAPFLDARGGLARLLDSPLPRNAPPPSPLETGRVEIAWTLVARVVAAPGGAAIPNATVTLLSAHRPGQTAATALTDDAGEARLEAVQVVLDRHGTRPGNPHVLRASAGGREGAAPALVIEGPATALVMVPGYGASSTNQLSGSQPASFAMR